MEHLDGIARQPKKLLGWWAATKETLQKVAPGDGKPRCAWLSRPPSWNLSGPGERPDLPQDLGRSHGKMARDALVPCDSRNVGFRTDQRLVQLGVSIVQIRPASLLIPAKACSDLPIRTAPPEAASQNAPLLDCAKHNLLDSNQSDI